MKLTRHLAVPFFLLCTASFAAAQEFLAPNISGVSVQGSEVDLKDFRGDKNVLVIFYRMHT